MSNYFFNLDNIEHLVNVTLKSYIRLPSIIFINGPMGVGKTTFVNAILSRFNHISPNSSSYSIVNTYSLNPPILHCDFFRTGWNDEIFETDILPLLTGKFSLYMEWVEPFIFSDNTSSISVNLSFASDYNRKIEISKLS